MTLQRTSQLQPPSQELPPARTPDLAIVRDAATDRNLTEAMLLAPLTAPTPSAAAVPALHLTKATTNV